MKGIDIKGKRVPIELDRTRYLIYDLNGLADLEEVVGDLDKFVKSLGKEKATLKMLRLLLWAGLVSEDETLTERGIGALILPSMFPELQNKVLLALNASMPSADDTPEKKPVIEESTG